MSWTSSGYKVEVVTKIELTSEQVEEFILNTWNWDSGSMDKIKSIKELKSYVGEVCRVRLGLKDAKEIIEDAANRKGWN